MSYVYGPPIIDSRIKALDVGIPLLQTEFEVRGLNTIHQLSNVMYDLEGLGNLSWTWTLGSNMRIISKENKVNMNVLENRSKFHLHNYRHCSFHFVEV